MLGRSALVLALAAVASVTMIGFTSFTSFNPADWLRIVTMAPLPFIFLGSVGCALGALRKGVGRTGAYVALALDAAAFTAFVVMIVVGG